MKRVNKHKKSWQINWSQSSRKVDKKYRCVIKRPTNEMVLTSQSFDVGVRGKFVMIPSRTIFISDSGIIYATQKKRKGKMDFARMDDLAKTVGKTVMVENFTL